MTPVADYTLQMHNSAKKVADESDVVFVDFNTVEMQEKMNYDYNTDTLDTGHLNYKGAHKFTELIGDILTHTYNVSRSSDERDYLNSDLKMFKRQIAANELSITSSAYELIDKLNDSNYNVIWNGTDSSDENIATLVGGSFGGDWQSFWRCEAIEKSEHYYVGQFENNIDYIVDESGIHASGNLNVSNELGLCYMVYDNVLGKIVDKGKIQQDGAIIRD